MAEPTGIAVLAGTEWIPELPRSRMLRGLRFARFAAAVILGLLVFLPPHLLWLTLSRGAPSPFALLFHRLACWSMGLRVRVAGEPFASHALIVANHISWTDILALGASAQMTFVAKSDVRDWPALGLLARLNPTLFIDRSARRGVRGQIDQVKAALRRGRVAVFPEGTTSNGSTLLLFRPALFDGAAGRPVQPVSIVYSPRDRSHWAPGALAAFAWDGDKTFMPHFVAIVATGGADVQVTAHQPILVGDRKARALAAYAVIRESLR